MAVSRTRQLRKGLDGYDTDHVLSIAEPDLHATELFKELRTKIEEI